LDRSERREDNELKGADTGRMLNHCN
jgi:hypothetical protein